MNFKVYKENKNNKLNEKDETIFDLYMLIIGYIIIIIFGIWFHKYFYHIIPSSVFTISIIAVVIFPLLIYSYYIFYEIHSTRQGISYKQLLEEVNLEIKKEEKIAGIIPVILFGIGIVYSNIEKVSKKSNMLKLVAPYLIFSLLFGTIIPNIISYLVFDHNNLHRLLVASDVDFISVSLSFGLMITTLLMPFFTIY